MWFPKQFSSWILLKTGWILLWLSSKGQWACSINSLGNWQVVWQGNKHVLAHSELLPPLLNSESPLFLWQVWLQHLRNWNLVQELSSAFKSQGQHLTPSLTFLPSAAGKVSTAQTRWELLPTFNASERNVKTWAETSLPCDTAEGSYIQARTMV